MPYEEVLVNPTLSSQQNELAVSGNLNANLPQTVLRLSSGQTVVLPTELLLSGVAGMSSGRYAAASSTSMDSTSMRSTSMNSASMAAGEVTGEMVVPLVAEQILVGKETVTTGKVRLHQGVEIFTESVALPLTRTSWEVERTKIGQLTEIKPEVRQEGDVMVFPLVEERLVAQRQYFLVEEVRVRQVAVTTEETASLELKRDVLTVERAIPEAS